MSVYQKEFSHAAAERANMVERLKLERQCKLYEKEYKYARRQAVTRREEARHEIRRLQQDKFSAVTFWPAGCVSPHAGTLSTGKDRVSVQCSSASQDGTNVPGCGRSQPGTRTTISSLRQNTTPGISGPNPSRSSGIPSVAATGCEKGSSDGSEPDRGNCGSPRGSSKSSASTCTVTTRPRVNSNLTHNTSHSISVPSPVKGSGMPSVATSAKGSSNSSDSDQGSCALLPGSSKTSISTTSSSSSTGPRVAIITSLSRSVDSGYNSETVMSRISAGQSSVMSRYDQTGGRDKHSPRYEDTHRHTRRYYGDLVTAILNRPSPTLPAPKIDKTHTDKQAALIIVEDEEEAEETVAEPDAEQCRCTDLPTQADSNGKGSCFKNIVKSVLADRASCAGASDNKTPRRVQFADESAASPKTDTFKSLLDHRRRSLPTDALLAPTHSLNTQNTLQKRRRSIDVSGNVTGTSDVIHRRRMSEQTLPDVALFREAAKGANSSTAIGGWRKLKTFVSTVAHLKNKGGPSNVEARMTRRHSSTSQLLIMFNEANKNRPTREILDMDRERKRLANGEEN